MDIEDDKHKTLRDIVQGGSLVTRLLEIQKWTTPQSKLLRFVTNLECFELEHGGLRPGFFLQRHPINIFANQQYVALSYTWDPSEYEDAKSGQYQFQARGEQGYVVSNVRNCVLDRTLNYMTTHGVNLLWIDAHSIVQETACENNAADDCGHTECREKQGAIEVMDLVYKWSNHPVALLGRPIELAQELDLLARLLQGRFTVSSSGTPQLSRNVSQEEAENLLGLLVAITQDRWWTRAWTFQESYRGGEKMRLLISHPPTLRDEKREYADRGGNPLFGIVEGELCIRSVKLSEQATRFCLALKEEIGHSSAIESVLSAVGRYKDILQPSQSMTPRIIADIEKRCASDCWDRLAIIANCCQYSIRLDKQLVQSHETSLSLLTLALCLLNGEVLDNGMWVRNWRMAEKTASQFIETSLLKGIQGREDRSLTFNKSCRFFDVTLTQEGTQTDGHLWELGDIIDTSNYRSSERAAWVNQIDGDLSLDQRKRLFWLANCLKAGDPIFYRLRKALSNYLDLDHRNADKEDHEVTFSHRYMRIMAAHVADTIGPNRGSIRLGRLWDPDMEDWGAYHAVFVGSWSEPSPEASYVFTSAASADNLDRHVSVEVDVEGEDRIGVSRLRIKRWLNGLCFFQGCPLETVLFPWPDGFV